MRKVFLAIFVLLGFSLFADELFYPQFMIPGEPQGYEDEVEQSLERAIASYIEGNLPGADDAEELHLESFEIFEDLWDDHKQDLKLTLYYCYGITAFLSTSPPLNQMTRYFMKMKGLLSYFVIQNPENLNGRNFRAMVFMNIPNIPGSSERPDETILEDTEVFLAGYTYLPEDLPEETAISLEIGKNICLTARSLVLLESGRRVEGLRNLRLVEERVLREAEENAGMELPPYRTYLDLAARYE